jgi:hypothetical protein
MSEPTEMAKYFEGLENLFLLETYIEHQLAEEDMSRGAARRLIRQSIQDFEGYLEVLQGAMEERRSERDGGES